MYVLDPNLPIEELRRELIALAEQLCKTADLKGKLFLRSEVVPLIKSNEEYARSMARHLIKSMREHGTKISMKMN